MTTEFPNWFNITAEDNFKLHVPKRKNLKALQIGAFTGDASRWLLDNRKIESLIDVDTWAGSHEEAHDAFNWNDVEVAYDLKIAGDERVKKHKKRSDDFFVELSNEYPPIEFDFIYIDGDHTATQVALDGLQGFRYLKQGGVMAFDDLTWRSGRGRFYDPAPGIEAVLHLIKDQVETLAENSQFWIRRK
jgi:predicted O-methyltransferase YrrM